jgi:HEAT repeat protein
MGRLFHAVRAALVGIVLIGVAPACFGHGEGPPRPPTPPPAAAYGQDLVRERVHPPRWSWIHWWEANRDPYLKSLKQTTALQKTDPKVLAEYRARAVKALVAGLAAPSGDVRAASALALARMNERAALKSIANMAAGDGDPRVAMAALTALGLLDCPEAREALLTQVYASDPLLEAGCVGLGFLRAVDDPKVDAALQQTVAGTKPGPATVSAWALRRHTDAASAQLMQSLLAQSKSPWLASEAILALGERGNAGAVPLLAELLLGMPQAQTHIAAYQALAEHDNEIVRLMGNVRVPIKEIETYKLMYQKQADWRYIGPNGQRLGPGPIVIRVGVEQIYMACLRVSAAIALGKLRAPGASEALLASLAIRDDGYVELYKGFSMMSLGQIGEPTALPVLLDYLSRFQANGKVRTNVDRESPLRGYAALALGLYARPRDAAQGPVDQPDYDKVCQALADRLADPEEEMEVRSACAMALGLTARTENLRHLQKAAEAVRPGDDPLAGYLLLARAMLADRNILAPARQYLDAKVEKKETSGLLGRRAAVLGLALLDSEEAIPTLLESWHLTYHVNREVAVALGLLRAYNVTDPLARLLELSPNPLEQAFAARCLGELFQEERPHRLRWLINDSNYTMKNERMLPYNAMANEFLYEYLIPCFGDRWL